MKVAVTGAEGKVGRALIEQLDPGKFQIVKLDLPQHDATNVADLTSATKGCDALIHLAWRDLDVNNVHPFNTLMYQNAYQAAVANKIPKIIMGSSNHARDHAQREADGKIRYSGQPEVANNIYGVEKQKMEIMGRYFAAKFGLDVLCLRIGNVNQEDKPRPDSLSRWLSHRDLGRLVTLALEAPTKPGNFEIMYAVSEQPTFDWVNSFGYTPLDQSTDKI